MAELHKLTVRARAAAVPTRRLDASTLTSAVDAMVAEAKQRKVNGRPLVLDLLGYASDLRDEEGRPR